MIERTIYALSDPRTNAIRYVGATKDTGKRLKRHLDQARWKGLDFPVTNWIRELISLGLLPTLQVLVEVSEDWPAEEQFWISKLSGSCDLLNISDGGDFSKGTKHKQPRKFTEIIANARIGIKRPDMAERNRRLADSKRGKKMNLSQAERERRGDRIRKFVQSENYRAPMLSKTAEERSEIVRKAWIARKRNKEKAL